MNNDPSIIKSRFSSTMHVKNARSLSNEGSKLSLITKISPLETSKGYI